MALPDITPEYLNYFLLYWSKRDAAAPYVGETGFINSPHKLIKSAPKGESVLDYFRQGPNGRCWFYGYRGNKRMWWVNHHPACNITCEVVSEEQYKQARVLAALQVLAEAKAEMEFKER